MWGGGYGEAWWSLAREDQITNRRQEAVPGCKLQWKTVSCLKEGRAVLSIFSPRDKQDVLINVIYVRAQKNVCLNQ